jgi:flagellar M-ring protein FliF
MSKGGFPQVEYSGLKYMASSIKNISEQARGFFKGLSLARKITLLAIVVGTLAGFMVLMFWSTRQEYDTLFTNLNSQDAGEILAHIKDQKIPFKIGDNGKIIRVPKERVHEVRMDLASAGLPKGSGVGFEIFDETNLGMTEFVQNVNYQRALQGELARTIGQIEEVEHARVHIVSPERSLFLEQEEPATASVALKLKANQSLDKGQIRGIVHLVSSSVSGLSPENVTIVDTSGKMLAGFEEKSDISQASQDQMAFQHKLENTLESRVKSMLDTALGSGKSIVRLSAEMDFRRSEKTEERFFPDNQVVRSQQLLSTDGSGPGDTVAGIPGVLSNMTTETKADSQQGRDAGFSKKDTTVNYEIGKMTRHIIEPVGEINRISVAVLVDGTYRQVETEDGTRQTKYFPRSSEELAKLEAIVRRAVNFDPERGDKVEVVNIPFETSRMDELKGEMAQETGPLSGFRKYFGLAKYAFLVLFLLLSFVFIVRPLMKWLIRGSDGEIIKQLPKTVGELEEEYAKNGKAISFTDQASQLISKDGETSVQLMKEWLKES